jgi:flagellar basal body L-ring protein FlgH
MIHHQAKHVLYDTQKEYTKCITTAQPSPNIETPRPPGTTNSESIWTNNSQTETFKSPPLTPLQKNDLLTVILTIGV